MWVQRTSGSERGKFQKRGNLIITLQARRPGRASRNGADTPGRRARNDTGTGNGRFYKQESNNGAKECAGGGPVRLCRIEPGRTLADTARQRPSAGGGGTLSRASEARRDLLLVLKDLKTRSLGHEPGLGMTDHSSILADRVPGGEEPRFCHPEERSDDRGASPEGKDLGVI